MARVRGCDLGNAAMGPCAVARLGLARAAPNDFEVQASNVAALKVGATLERGARIVVPTGGAMTLIDRTGGAVRTRECAGRYQGPVGQCPMPSATEATRTTPGGVRGALP
jgi:hypothetical protein